jgi:hypothetical protein
VKWTHFTGKYEFPLMSEINDRRGVRKRRAALESVENKL